MCTLWSDDAETVSEGDEQAEATHQVSTYRPRLPQRSGNVIDLVQQRTQYLRLQPRLFIVKS